MLVSIAKQVPDARAHARLIAFDSHAAFDPDAVQLPHRWLYRRDRDLSMNDPVLGAGSLVAGRYRISGLIARGGMGAVHAAVDERLSREVALKTLRPELVEDRTLVARFEREAQTAARLAHPCIAQVLDFGTSPEGLLYLVMERVRGETLATLLKREGRLAPLRAADIVEQTLGALASAHAEGVVHRDLKPGNIMIVPSGESRETVKLLDFGIAHLMDGAAYTRLTQTGIILGTPTFMSPEQALGERIDARTDVYAMGVILWCLLTGQKPFSGSSMADVVEAILTTPPPLADAIAPEVPNELARVADFAMQKDRERRFVDANAMGRALVAFRSRESAPSHTPSLLPDAQTPSVSHHTQQATPERAAPTVSLPPALRSRPVLLLALGGLVLMTSSCLALGLVGLAISTGWLARATSGVASEGGLAAPTLGAGASEGCVLARRCCEAAAGDWGAACDSITNPYTTSAQCAQLLQGYRQGLVAAGRDPAVCDSATSSAPGVAAATPAAPARTPSETCVRTQRCCHAFMGHFIGSSDRGCDVYTGPFIQEHTCAETLANFRASLRSTSTQMPECE